jgi:hypothetical protein
MSYCVADTGLSSRALHPREFFSMGYPDLVLFEIASPVSFNRGASGHAAMTQLAKWAIWNVACAAELAEKIWGYPERQFLVSPSNVWTRGYDLKTRHALAKCKQPKKDLRECEAMIWFYRQRPQDWQPLPDYLASF